MCGPPTSSLFVQKLGFEPKPTPIEHIQYKEELNLIFFSRGRSSNKLFPYLRLRASVLCEGPTWHHLSFTLSQGATQCGDKITFFHTCSIQLSYRPHKETGGVRTHITALRELEFLVAAIIFYSLAILYEIPRIEHC